MQEMLLRIVENGQGIDSVSKMYQDRSNLGVAQFQGDGRASHLKSGTVSKSLNPMASLNFPLQGTNELSHSFLQQNGPSFQMGMGMS